MPSNMYEGKCIRFVLVTLLTTCKHNCMYKKKLKIPYALWLRGAVVSVSVSVTEDRGFEYRQGVRFLGA
jgi:hypothetical protein